MARSGRPLLWGQGTQWTSARVPLGELDWLDAWAKSQGYTRSYAFVLFLRNAKREGTAAQRALQAEADLQLESRRLATAQRQRDKALRDLEAEQGKNRGLRDRLQRITKRAESRLPAELLRRLFSNDES